MLRQFCRQAAPRASSLIAHGRHRHFSSSTPAAAIMRRGYREALEKLGQLSSNRSVTSLFEPSGPASQSQKPPARDLNANALPEVLTWLRRAGYSPLDLTRMKHIHVAGTKGKGSVCAFATAMLARYGPVGTYTSPHLVSPRERIAINGVPVAQDVFAKAFFEIWDRFSAAARGEGVLAEMAEGPASKPFYFRFLTILAWHIFLTHGIKDVVMEVGIGGEFDDTNVLPGEAVSAAVVTKLGVDHVAMLGDTVEEIAWHKAGIMKRGVKAFTMRLDDRPSVMEVLRTRAAEKGAELVELDDRQVESWGGVPGILRGQFQKNNQALAVAAVREHLGLQYRHDAPLEGIPDRMVQGLREASLRGRCEIVHDGEHDSLAWYLDGAHTIDSLYEVASWMSKSLEDKERVVLIFNQQERNAAELLSWLWDAVKRASKRDDVFCNAIFTRNEVDRPEEGEGEGPRDLGVQNKAAERMGLLAAEEGMKIGVSVFDNVTDAVAEARRLSQVQAKGGRRHKVLVTGSLHLVGGVLRILEPESLL